MNRTSIFQNAKEAVQSLDIPKSYDRHVQSVVQQLNFLIDFAEGTTSDLELLESLNFGIVAARIIEEFNLDVAESVHSASGEWRKMKSENGLS